MQERETSSFADVLARPSAAGSLAGTLSDWDDFAVHQAAAPVTSVTPAHPGWTERFYFNVLRPTGEIVAVIGGGVYPARGLGESYFCRIDGDEQHNVRGWHPLPTPGERVEPGPFALRCEVPLRDWSLSVDLPDAPFAGRFGGTMAPYLYPTIDIPALEPDGPFDLHCHFVAMGRWQLDELAGLATSDGMLGVRDRTWGVRSRRPRLHVWSVLSLGERTLAFHHQELADASVLMSHAAVVHGDGRVEPLSVTGHDLRFHPRERLIDEGEVRFSGENGPLTVTFARVGHGMRLAGAGYDDRQGDRGVASGVQRDVYGLGDPAVAAQTGRGTIDSGVRAQATGAWTAEGVGVVETAVARDHVGYGGQLTRG